MEIDRIKEKMQILQIQLNALYIYMPIKKAILENQELNELEWTNLDQIHKSLSYEIKIREQRYNAKKELFLNFNRPNVK